MATDFPTQKHAVIYADPPWAWKTRTKKGLDGRPQHYARMSLKDIKALPVEFAADSDCWLFLWTTGPHLEQALGVIRAWGFKYSGVAFTWVKLKASSADAMFLTTHEDFHVGMGYTTRKNTEMCLLARRGKPKRLSKSVRELLISGIREHSRKPDEAYRRIEEFAPGPYLELFARANKPGWTSWGNETEKFGEVL
jgi:N6-adenosine-specific RNA methylase IME4